MTTPPDVPITSLQQLFTELAIFHLIQCDPHPKYRANLHDRLDLPIESYARAESIIAQLPYLPPNTLATECRIDTIRSVAKLYGLDTKPISKLGSFDPWTGEWVWNCEREVTK